MDNTDNIVETTTISVDFGSGFEEYEATVYVDGTVILDDGTIIHVSDPTAALLRDYGVTISGDVVTCDVDRWTVVRSDVSRVYETGGQVVIERHSGESICHAVDAADVEPLVNALRRWASA